MHTVSVQDMLSFLANDGMISCLWMKPFHLIWLSECVLILEWIVDDTKSPTTTKGAQPLGALLDEDEESGDFTQTPGNAATPSVPVGVSMTEHNLNKLVPQLAQEIEMHERTGKIVYDESGDVSQYTMEYQPHYFY